MARKKSAAKKAREAAATAAATATATTTNSTENAKDIKFEKPSLQKLPQNKKTLSPSKESDPYHHHHHQRKKMNMET